MRPYYWPQRIAIVAACFVAVLLLATLGGCDRPADVSACYERCQALHERCGSATFARHLSPFNDSATHCVCSCTFDMPFADGGGP